MSVSLHGLHHWLPQGEGMSSVIVVVDRLSKYAIFIVASHACPADLVANLFYKNMVKYIGLPTNFVSDKDTRFTRRFWISLFGLLGSKLNFFTINHFQSDG